MPIIRKDFKGDILERALINRSTLDSLVIVLLNDLCNSIGELQAAGPITATRGAALDERIQLCIMLFDGLVKPHAHNVSLDLSDQLTAIDKLVVSLILDMNRISTE